MLKTSYTGSIEMLGSGVYTSNWIARRSIIKIGDVRIRNVMLTDTIDSYLEQYCEDEGPAEVALSVGWLMFFRWALAIKYKDEVTREGIFMFVAGMITHAFVAGLAALIFTAAMGNWLGGLGFFIGLLACLYVLATLVLNIKAWLILPS